jgi:plastocyanin
MGNKESKHMKKRLVLVIAVVAVVVLAAFAAVSLLTPQESEPQEKAAQATAYVDITNTSFIPQTLQIAKGTKVVWVNKDTSPHQVASDPYPDRTALPGLFSEKPLAADESYSFTFSKEGTFTYHDYLNPSAFQGTVVVKP